MNVPLRPLGAKFFGMFLAPHDWPAFDINVWKAEIDACVALDPRINFVAYWGDLQSAKLGLPAYLDKRRQLIEYIGLKGLYGLPYGMFNPSDWGTVTNAEACPMFAADALLHSGYPHIIGYVSTDEPWVGGAWSDATIVANCAAQYAAMKAVVPPDFGICASASGLEGPVDHNVFDYTGLRQTRTDSIAPYCDFFCVHPFYAHTASQAVALNNAFPGKQIIMPSTVARLEGDTEIPAITASLMALVGGNNIRGFGWWTSVDFSSNTWAIMNSNFTPRPVKANAFLAGNTAVDIRNHRIYRGKPRATELNGIGYR